MPITTTRSLLLPALLLALAACGGDDRAGGAAAADSVQKDDPAAIYGVPAARNVRLTPVEIEVRDLPPGWSGMRIAALSDFNLGLWADNEAVAAAAVRRAVEARPDLVVLLGDYVVRGEDYGALDRVLAPLRGRRVVAVLGDRDMLDNPESPDSGMIRTVEALTRNGVQVLRDARVPIARGGDTAYVAGLEPYVVRKPEWRQADIYAGIPAAVVLLSHLPVAAITVPRDRYPAMLAGHTFCGDVEVPGTPRLAWFNREILPGTPEPAKTRIWRVRGTTLFA
ncbi:MAG TPA: metallophosphoesterase, partial [Longimicrobiaceae bacterium]|nr:metallophosphoesterase [Longimicrobiaceae bacterium]